MHFVKFTRLLYILLLPLLAQSINAGQIVLTNGDSLQGELKSVDSDSLVWQSTLLGEIKIPKSSVESMDSSTVLPVVKSGEAYANDCVIKLDNGLTTQCLDGELDTHSLAMVTSFQRNPDAMVHSGNVKLNYDRRDGNADTEDLDFSTTANWQNQKYRHAVELTAESDKSEGVVQNEKYEADYQLDYDFAEHWFSYGNIGYEKDRFSAIEQQYELGSGFGHRYRFENMIETEAQLGLAYLQSELADGDKENDLAGKWALKVRWPIPGTRMDIFHRQEYIWPWDDMSSYQLESSTGLKMPLLAGVFGEFRYDFDYTAEVTEDTKHADEEWVISLGYEW